jgi:hypothetical protein
MKWVLIVLAVVAALVAVVAVIGMMLPKGHVESRSSKFRQPPQAVWDAIAGPPTWRSELRSFEELAPRDGHYRWKETDQRGEVITYEREETVPPTRLVTRIAEPNLPYGGRWIHEITATPDGCVLKITEDGEIYNPIFRFMARFVFGYSGAIETYLKSLHAKFGEAGD